MLRWVVAAAITMAVGSAGHAAEIAAYKDGGWDISAFTGSANGAFRGCSGYSAFGDGVNLFISLVKPNEWNLGFSKRGLRFRDGSKVRLRISIDGRPVAEGDANGGPNDLLLADLSIGVVNAFRQGSTMELSGPTFSVSIDLSGTSRLVATLSDCVARYGADPKYAGREQLPPAPKPAITAPPPPPAAPPASASAARPQPQPPAKPAQGSSSGTAFVVTTAGHLVTNAHVVRECKDIRIQKPGDVEIEAKLVVSDGTNDLALLKTPLTPAAEETVRITNSRTVQAGARIAVYGFPLSGALSTSGNIVEGNVSALAGLENDAGYFQISAPVQPGNSGGPLLDSHGSLVGVVSSKLNELAVAKSIGTLPQNVNFAIKSNVLANFLDANSIPYETVEGGTEIDLPAIAAKAQRFTVLVTCRR